MKKITILAIAAVIVVSLGLHAKSVLQTTANAYLYAYPLVLMEETRKEMQQQNQGNASGLYHNQMLPDHNFRSVVRPNNDTLYSISWLDLSNGPQVLSVPKMERYYVMPFMDAWTNVFDTVGTKATGNAAGDYAIVGPNWRGKLPEELPRIKAPTNMVWMIGRVQINGQKDMATVKQLQQQFHITPLNDFAQGDKNTSGVFAPAGRDKKGHSPMETVEAMNARDFFQRFNQLSSEQSSASGDQVLLKSIESLGIGPGQKLTQNPLSRWLMEESVEMVRDKINDVAKLSRANEQGWSIALSDIGRYGTNYQARAFIAKFGLGALPPEEAVYPTAEVDVSGQPLHGANRYLLHFPAGATPPADAFWSITMYDHDGFMIDNPLRRYTIGDRDELAFNSDGSLDIYIQHQQPQNGTSNWLPSPAEDFTVTMRIYLPGTSVLDSSWKLPAIEKVKN